MTTADVARAAEEVGRISASRLDGHPAAPVAAEAVRAVEEWVADPTEATAAAAFEAASWAAEVRVREKDPHVRAALAAVAAVAYAAWNAGHGDPIEYAGGEVTP